MYYLHGGTMEKQIVKGKQNNSRMCVVCGLENRFGLYTRFYEIEGNEVVALAMGRDEHQGYPGRMHGGLITALLDETIGRAVMIEDPDAWGVTVELNVRFRQPVPLNTELRVVGRIDKLGSKIFAGSAELMLPDGTPAATATGKYVRLSIDSIVEDADAFAEEWFQERRDQEPEVV